MYRTKASSPATSTRIVLAALIYASQHAIVSEIEKPGVFLTTVLQPSIQCQVKTPTKTAKEIATVKDTGNVRNLFK
jgi:hypothetical protein